ncbi:MAG: hypothetical protein IID32_11725, partial [Planctomycetes bacterium]|nr:hypothetical protein [Planctomycetota bacterium]
GQFSGGSGTSVDPYLISNPNDLQAIGLNSSHWDKHFKLTADLDMTGVAMTPIGNLGTPFSGTFDGGENTIGNLTVDIPSDNVGLFGIVDNALDPKTIYNLGLINPNIAGNNRVGALAGDLINGTIAGCYADGGSVGGNLYVGGLVGSSSGTISDCYATGPVTGTGSRIGGLVGVNGGGSKISESYATGPVTGTGDFVGGLVGRNGGTITNSYATGQVNGTNDIGGLVGRVSGTISICYATGQVNGTDDVGGLVGENKGTISDCYASGAVSGTSDVGGLVGFDNGGTVGDSFWDMDTSGQASSAGGTGKTTAEMQTVATFTDAGWDFVGETTNGIEDIWRMCTDGVDYPRLTWQYVGIGDFGCPDGVGIEDLVLFSKWWVTTNCSAANDWCEGADFNQSGAVDLADALVLFGNWLSGI